MTQLPRLFGSELSPYSVKVRSYLRYKGIAHQWIVRGASSQADFQAHAKLPLIPLLVMPDGEALQDSTPLIETLEARNPEPALQPPDAPRAFLSALIEEYADEWGNKAMFHYRWTYEADRLSASKRIAQAILGVEAKPQELEHTATGVAERMAGRLSFVGSDAANAPLIEMSFRRQLEIAEAHLQWRPYLFGGRPCLADFGWAAQMYELASDPTPQALMQHCPATLAWVARMVSPVALGEFEQWQTLSNTLTPLLQEEVARRYLPWADANLKASQAGAASMSADLGGATFTQAPQKYHGRTLTAIRSKAGAALQVAPELAGVLKDTGCYDLLVPQG